MKRSCCDPKSNNVVAAFCGASIGRILECVPHWEAWMTWRLEIGRHPFWNNNDTHAIQWTLGYTYHKK